MAHPATGSCLRLLPHQYSGHSGRRCSAPSMSCDSDVHLHAPGCEAALSTCGQAPGRHSSDPRPPANCMRRHAPSAPGGPWISSRLTRLLAARRRLFGAGDERAWAADRRPPQRIEQTIIILVVAALLSLTPTGAYPLFLSAFSCVPGASRACPSSAAASLSASLDSGTAPFWRGHAQSRSPLLNHTSAQSTPPPPFHRSRSFRNHANSNRFALTCSRLALETPAAQLGPAAVFSQANWARCSPVDRPKTPKGAATQSAIFCLLLSRSLS